MCNIYASKIRGHKNYVNLYHPFIKCNMCAQSLEKSTIAIWFTGLSGSGKSTLAVALKYNLEQAGHVTSVFDGDVIRKGLSKDLGFSLNDRFENIRRIAEVNRLFLNSGIITINAFISPTEDIRKMAKEIIGENSFFEIYLSTPLKKCMERDPKGLYKKISDDGLKGFTGIDSIFEPSQFADLKIDTSEKSIDSCIELIVAKIDELLNRRI